MYFSLFFLLSKLLKNLPSPYSPNFMFLFSEKKKINPNIYIKVHTKVLFVLTNYFWTLTCLEYSFWHTIHCRHFLPSILYCGIHFQVTLFCCNGWICQSNAYYICVYITYIYNLYKLHYCSTTGTVSLVLWPWKYLRFIKKVVRGDSDAA